jgi:hypothetical protein
MKKRSLLLVWTILVAATAPGVAMGKAKSIEFAVYGGYQRYAMGDVNDAIDTPGTFFPGAAARGDRIHGGGGFGAGFRVWPSERVRVAVDVSRLLAKTTGTAVFLGTPYSAELDVPSTGVSATVAYFFPSLGRARLGLGAGAGYYNCTGRASATASGTTLSTTLDGSGFGAHGEGVGEIRLSSLIRVEVGAGYRFARTTDVEAEGMTLLNADGSKSRVDWSGVTARAGLAVSLSGGPAAR